MGFSFDPITARLAWESPGERVDLTVLALDGRIVLRATSSDAFDLSGIERGVYLIRMRQGAAIVNGNVAIPGKAREQKSLSAGIP